MLPVSILLLALAGRSAIAVPSCGADEVCPKHEHYVTDDVDCLKTCGNRLNASQETAGACAPYSGCVCDSGYVRLYDNATGKCILECECAPIPETCGLNEEPTSCRIICPPQTCESIRTIYLCNNTDCEPGCNCKNDYLRDSSGVCIKSEECPTGDVTPPVIECGPNEVISECAKSCPESCESLDPYHKCDDEECSLGCACRDGYRRNSRGNCISSKLCPKVSYTFFMMPTNPSTHIYKQSGSSSSYSPYAPFTSITIVDLSEAHKTCNGDPNAIYKVCTSPCPRTCDHPNLPTCPTKCMGPGCECRTGFVLNKITGKCIKPEHCPGSKKCEDPHATYKECRSACPKTCTDHGDDRVCPAVCREAGCECNPGYVLTEAGGKCIKPEYCPASCEDPNAVYSNCPSSCPKICGILNTDVACIDVCAKPGCECKPDYVLTEVGGKCVLPENCPVKCGGNSTYNECGTACPATCSDPEPQSCIEKCVAGCMCNSGYVINDGVCILPQDCPVQCGKNETYNECGTACPPTCLDPEPEVCIDMCVAGCQCKSGFILNGDGVCIDPKDCPVKCGKNETYNECGTACPPTCSEPEPDVCIDMCVAGCQCKSGFILNGDGVCIDPKDCPGGSPTCSANETYVYCKVGCPNNNCRVDDSRAIIACDPPYPCPSGCACKEDYLLTNDGDERCILATDCPPINCTRPNEVLDPRPSSCLTERCEDIKNPPNCDIFYYDRPTCVCQQGYYRNQNDICVPASECFECGANATFSDCGSACPDTCSSRGPKICIALCVAGCVCNPGYILNSDGKCILVEDCPVPENETCSVTASCRRTCGHPNPENCPYTPAEENIDGCECQEGYILSEFGGKCIKIEDCPDQSCNDDPHARVKKCPRPCPSTCDSPDASPCKKMCEPIGCECVDGYMFSEKDGKCVLPEDCPGGDPCGPNAMFSPCNFDCPHNFCPQDDSRDVILCKPPRDCLSGCVCRLNNKRKSYENRTCIESSSCPPVKCRRPNEVWNSCPSACLAENCTDVDKKPVTCNTFVLNCEPKCVCKKNYFRNKKDICVTAKECRPDHYEFYFYQVRVIEVKSNIESS